MAKNNDFRLLDNDEIVQGFVDDASAFFQVFQSQREDVDKENKIADYMYACAQNRLIAQAESGNTMALEKDPRSNVGSVIFHRQVNQLAAQLVSILNSSPDLFRYGTYRRENADISGMDSKDRAKSATLLARWTRKEDQLDEKLPEFANHIFKYSNVFVQIGWIKEKGKRKFKEPEYRVEANPQTGQEERVIVGEREVEREVVVKNYPVIRFPHIDMIYADANIPTIKDQNCVIILSLRNRAEIKSDVLEGFLSEDAYAELDDKYEWDGEIGAKVKKEELDNRGRELEAQASKLFLQWDVYMRSPVTDDEGSWDEDEGEYKWYWGTFIGNKLDDALPMRLERNPDPDDEPPLKEIHALSDKSDMLYHTSLSGVIRSYYSVDCTLLNLTLDNLALINDPPTLWVDGEHRVKDFRFVRGQRWSVNSLNAMKQAEIRDATTNTRALREGIRDEIKQALNTDPAFMGEYAGARTSATEFMGVNENSRMPQMVQHMYIISQFLPWIARKYMSYWEAYGEPEQVVQITDQNKLYKIHPKEVSGEFDVEVDIVNRYIDDQVKEQRFYQILNTVSNNPIFQQSSTHKIHAGNLLKQLFERAKFDPTEFVIPVTSKDSEANARGRIESMLYTGQYTPPTEGEDADVHLMVARGERLRWKGIEDSPDPRAQNLPLLDQYIAELQFMMESQGRPAGGSPEQINPPQSGGQVMQEQLGAALGGLSQ